MEHIKCFNCDKELEINISNAIDENGEVFICPFCGKMFMYSNN